MYTANVLYLHKAGIGEFDFTPLVVLQGKFPSRINHYNPFEYVETWPVGKGVSIVDVRVFKKGGHTWLKLIGDARSETTGSPVRFEYHIGLAGRPRRLPFSEQPPTSGAIGSSEP